MLVQHLLRMCLRCGSERRVPMERLQTLIHASLVGQVKKLLLLTVGQLLGLQSCCGQRQDSDKHMYTHSHWILMPDLRPEFFSPPMYQNAKPRDPRAS